jgi:endonuclease-3 related protein
MPLRRDQLAGHPPENAAVIDPGLSVVKPTRKTLTTVFEVLYGSYGPQHWWPGESPFEIMVGAVLTQNTAWTNVEKAIANLVAHDRLDADRIVAARKDHLANWLRPSGYFNVKAERLKNFCRWYLDAGGYTLLSGLETDELRESLLGVNGVGPETADDILLYAFERPVFVIDAYTRRLLARLGLFAGDEPYDVLRLAIEKALGQDVALFNEYHALIVHHAKQVCRTRPDCKACVLRARCPAAG